jgi:hypothetical protein
MWINVFGQNRDKEYTLPQENCDIKTRHIFIDAVYNPSDIADHGLHGRKQTHCT